MHYLYCDCGDGGVIGEGEAACLKAWEQRCENLTTIMAEEAWERWCSDFYGGSAPVTIAEQCAAAWEQKKELDR